MITTRMDPDDARVKEGLRALRGQGHDVLLAAPFTGFGRRPHWNLPCLDLPAHDRSAVRAALARRSVLRHRGPDFDTIIDLDQIGSELRACSDLGPRSELRPRAFA